MTLLWVTATLVCVALAAWLAWEVRGEREAERRAARRAQLRVALARMPRRRVHRVYPERLAAAQVQATFFDAWLDSVRRAYRLDSRDGGKP